MSKRVSWFALAAALFVFSFPAEAQQTGKVARIGFLDSSTASGAAVFVKTFRQELEQSWMD
jgi:hypothetical protein